MIKELDWTIKHDLPTDTYVDDTESKLLEGYLNPSDMLECPHTSDTVRKAVHTVNTFAETLRQADISE